MPKRESSNNLTILHMNALVKMFEKLCFPAKIYVVVMMITGVFMIFHGVGPAKVGGVEVEIAHRGFAVLALLLKTTLFAVLMQMMCRYGCECMSWLLAIFTLLVTTAVAVLGMLGEEHKAKARKMLSQMGGRQVLSKDELDHMSSVERHDLYEKLIREKMLKEKMMREKLAHEELRQSVERSA